ncbi:hypothetical protein IWZ00DRAFT_299294 [Phyllosticta capitalensis]
MEGTQDLERGPTALEMNNVEPKPESSHNEQTHAGASDGQSTKNLGAEHPTVERTAHHEKGVYVLCVPNDGTEDSNRRKSSHMSLKEFLRSLIDSSEHYELSSQPLGSQQIIIAELYKRERFAETLRPCLRKYLQYRQVPAETIESFMALAGPKEPSNLEVSRQPPECFFASWQQRYPDLFLGADMKSCFEMIPNMKALPLFMKETNQWLHPWMAANFSVECSTKQEVCVLSTPQTVAIVLFRGIKSGIPLCSFLRPREGWRKLLTFSIRQVSPAPTEEWEHFRTAKQRLIDHLKAFDPQAVSRPSAAKYLQERLAQVIFDDEVEVLACIDERLGDIDAQMTNPAWLRNSTTQWVWMMGLWRAYLQSSQKAEWQMARTFDLQTAPPDLLTKRTIVQKHFESTFTALTAMISISESKKAILQAEQVMRLTKLATFFIPLAFVASLFGMNLKEFDSADITTWVYTSVAFLLTTYFILYYQTVWTILKVARLASAIVFLWLEMSSRESRLVSLGRVVGELKRLSNA